MEELVQTLQDADAQLNGLDPIPFPLPLGRRAAAVAGAWTGVEATDWVLPGLRERVGAVVRGCSVERLVDGHAGARPYKVAPVSASPAARALHACGLAMADRERAVLCFLGEGSASYGELHEALNLAALHKLRVLFVVLREDLAAEGSPLAPQLSAKLVELAQAHGVQARGVDGGNAAQVRAAVSEAREGRGPWLIEVRSC